MKLPMRDSLNRLAGFSTTCPPTRDLLGPTDPRSFSFWPSHTTGRIWKWQDSNLHSQHLLKVLSWWLIVFSSRPTRRRTTFRPTTNSPTLPCSPVHAWGSCAGSPFYLNAPETRDVLSTRHRSTIKAVAASGSVPAYASGCYRYTAT